MKKFIIFLMSIFLLMGCSQEKIEVDKTDDLIQVLKSVEVYSEVYLSDVISVSESLEKNSEKAQIIS